MSEEDRINLARLETRVTSWMNSTNEYRLSLCAKIDKIVEKIEALPCRVREERSKQETRTQTLLWTGVWVVIGTIGGILIAHLGWR